MYNRVLFLCSPCAPRQKVPCSTSRVVPGAHRVVGTGTHHSSGPRDVHTTLPPLFLSPRRPPFSLTLHFPGGPRDWRWRGAVGMLRRRVMRLPNHGHDQAVTSRWRRGAKPDGKRAGTEMRGCQDFGEECFLLMWDWFLFLWYCEICILVNLVRLSL
jgi:hypothetical protein